MRKHARNERREMNDGKASPVVAAGIGDDYRRGQENGVTAVAIVSRRRTAGIAKAIRSRRQIADVA